MLTTPRFQEKLAKQQHKLSAVSAFAEGIASGSSNSPPSANGVILLRSAVTVLASIPPLNVQVVATQTDAFPRSANLNQRQSEISAQLESLQSTLRRIADNQKSVDDRSRRIVAEAAQRESVVKQLDGQRYDLQKQVEELQSRLKAQESDADGVRAESSELKRALAQHREHAGALRRQLDEVRAARDQTIADRETEMAKLRARISRLEREQDDYKVDVLRHPHCQELQRQLDAAATDMDLEKQGRLEALQQWDATSHQIETEIGRHQDAVSSFREDLGKLRTQVDKQKTQKNYYRDQTRVLQAELEATRARERHNDAELRDLRIQLAAQQTNRQQYIEVERMRAQALLQQVEDRLRWKIRLLQGYVEDLRRQVQLESIERLKAQRAVTILQGELAQAQHYYSSVPSYLPEVHERPSAAAVREAFAHPFGQQVRDDHVRDLDEQLSTVGENRPRQKLPPVREMSRTADEKAIV